ncbi:MAG: hypothetical protein AAGK30_03940, partial [Pseudomonadota bacterium]
MSTRSGFAARKARFLNRWHARRATKASAATAFVSTPEPRTIGSFARGRQLVAGNYLFAGSLIEAKGTPIWDVAAPDRAYETAIHGFAWLDDLVAVGDASTRTLGQEWLWAWIARFHTRDRARPRPRSACPWPRSN